MQRQNLTRDALGRPFVGLQRSGGQANDAHVTLVEILAGRGAAGGGGLTAGLLREALGTGRRPDGGGGHLGLGGRGGR